MDLANNTPLYLAHQNGRKAEKHLKNRDYDQAIECHLTATELLQEAMTLTSFAKSLESLQLQKNYHLSQTKIIRAQKLQYVRKKQQFELKIRKKMEKRKLPEVNAKDKELQWAILRTMEEADSLINELSEKHETEEENVRRGSLKPGKDMKTIMEELKVVNAQLRSLINKLLSQLESSRKETDILQSRLNIYETLPLPELKPLEEPSMDFSSL